AGTYGTLHLNADGSYTYTLDNSKQADHALPDCANATNSYTYTNSDNHGGSSSTSLDITVTGTNDAPVAVADTNSVTEDTPPNPVGGNVLTNDTDVDVGDTHTVTAVTLSLHVALPILAGTYGTLHLNADGSYTYTLDNS